MKFRFDLCAHPALLEPVHQIVHPSMTGLPLLTGKCEARSSQVHDGVIRASVEHDHGRLAVQLPVEQDHAVDSVGANGVRSTVLREKKRGE
jgi:hypothetical protein